MKMFGNNQLPKMTQYSYGEPIFIPVGDCNTVIAINLYSESPELNRTNIYTWNGESIEFINSINGLLTQVDQISENSFISTINTSTLSINETDLTCTELNSIYSWNGNNFTLLETTETSIAKNICFSEES